MDIKEIALKICRGMNPYSDLHESEFIYFANKLIESYKAELLKEVGEPVAVTNQAQLGYVTDGMHPDIPLAMWAKETSYSGANIALYTSDQLAAAIIKATKPLEEKLSWLDYTEKMNKALVVEIEELRAQLAKAEQLWQVAQGRCDGLEEKLTKAEQRVAEWQPIETAPKCSSAVILGFDPSWYDIATPMFWSEKKLNWRFYQIDEEIRPTHWMPLPKAPNGASS